ncbi:hypothetical protein [Paenibacillus sp. FSL R5-0908]|uniref:hypothetical protein n=1 Tax=Paenibacillus sp. FSL R5-0908 TaxID=2921664 RepID=UPI0030F91B59
MPATKALITILESVMEYAGETQELTESEKGTIVKNLHEVCAIMDRYTYGLTK